MVLLNDYNDNHTTFYCITDCTLAVYIDEVEEEEKSNRTEYEIVIFTYNCYAMFVFVRR